MPPTLWWFPLNSKIMGEAGSWYRGVRQGPCNPVLTTAGSTRPHKHQPGALLAAAAAISDFTCSDTAVYHKIKINCQDVHNY